MKVEVKEVRRVILHIIRLDLKLVPLAMNVFLFSTPRSKSFKWAIVLKTDYK